MGRIQPGCLRRFRHVCMGFLIVVSCALGQSSPGPMFPSNQSNEAQGRITSQLFTLSRLGPEHLANAVYRKGAERNSCIVAWGDRLLQWPLAKNGAMREVYPRQEDWRYNNGGCAWDVDGDGVDEIVTSRGPGGHGGTPRQHELVWFDEVEGQGQFRIHTFARMDIVEWAAPHDIQPLEVQVGEERVRGVVYNVSRRQLYFAEVPHDPEAEWLIHAIGRFPSDMQSGMEIADIDGDGRDDIVSGMFWIRTPQDPRRGNWSFYRYGEWQENQWAGMVKPKVQDMDGDGVAEIVVTEAEIPEARLAIFKRGADPTKLWQTHRLDKGLYAPHSLEVTDADEDGDYDIIAGEMTAGGWDFPMQENPTIWIYVNQGGLRFHKCPLAQGEGVHEMKLAPVRIDGMQVLFAADEIQLWKFSEMDTHVGFWLIVPPRRSPR